MTELNQPVPCWIIHDGETILDASLQFCELFHCESVRQIVGQPVISIIYGDDFQALAKFRGKYIMRHEENKTFNQEYDFLRIDGTCFRGRATSQRIEIGKYKTEVEWLYDVRG